MNIKNDKLAYFSVDILFSEALDFGLEEIANAVSEDYPETAISVHPVHAGKHIKTDEPVLGMLKPVDPRNGYVVTLNGLGAPDEEFRAADNSEIAWHSGGFAHCAIDALASHTSYVSVSIQTMDHSRGARFRAVRQLMAVSAVLAELPIALGVLVHWSSHMIEPGFWVEGVKKAMRGELPLSQWISYRSGWVNAGNKSDMLTSGYTKGLRSFVGYEVHLASAPIPPSDAKLLLKNVCSTILQCETAPRNGDLLGLDNDPVKYKVRRSQNAKGTMDPVLVLMHPDIWAQDDGDVSRLLPNYPPTRRRNSHFRDRFVTRQLFPHLVPVN